jgi:transcriptional regulator with XRE-family HTH domain
MAKRLGISYSTLSRIENGEESSGATLAAVLRWVLERTKKD